MLSEVDITLRIQSNVNYPVLVNIFGNNYNLRDTTNSKTEYRWDITNLVFASNQTLILEYKISGAAVFSNYSGSYQQPTVSSILEFLNALGIGYFSTYIETGNTYISTYNDNYVFGNLTINGSTYASVFISTFNQGTGFNAEVTTVKQDSTGKIICGGKFISYNGNTAQRIAKILNTGAYDPTFNTVSGFNGGVDDVFINSSDDIFCVGAFTGYKLAVLTGIIKLDSLANQDVTYNVGTGLGGSLSGGTTNGTAVIQDSNSGDVFIVGNFTDYDSNPFNGIVKTNSLGVRDNTFGANIGTGFDLSPSAIAFSSDGNIICVGAFNFFDGNAREKIVKINKVGVLLTPTFGTGFNNDALALYCYSTGEILVGGQFTAYNGTANINRIVRLTSAGVIDSSFNIGSGASAGFTGGIVRGFNVNESTGKIVVTGNFTAYNGTPCNGIIRLNGNGSVDTTWNYGTGVSGGSSTGISVAELSNFTYVLGGDFTFFDGNVVGNIANLLG